MAALLLHLASWLPGSGELLVWRVRSVPFAQTLMTAVILAQVYRPGTVNRHRILGAVAAYLLLGLVWAQACQLVALVHPGAFTGAIDSGAQGARVYFSFVTLTTTGYGDILLARLVSLQLAR